MPSYINTTNEGLASVISLQENVPGSSLGIQPYVYPFNYPPGSKVKNGFRFYVTSSAISVSAPFNLTDGWVEIEGTKKAFAFTGGIVKAEDNINVAVAFIGFFRVYYEDFVPDVLWMIQRNVTAIIPYKTLILTKILTVFNKYIPVITVQAININYDPLQRKQLGIGVTYGFNLPTMQQNQSFQTVSFVSVNGSN